MNITMDDLRRFRDELAKLSGMTIHIGLPSGKTDDDILMFGTVHEYGATIRAKRVKHLAIPLCKKAKDKSPRDFSDLFFIEDSGTLYGVRDKGKDQLEFLYWLPRSVKIPERSFIRGSYDNNKEEFPEICKYAVVKILSEKWSAEQVAHYIGGRAVSIVQNYFSRIQPPKSKTTMLTAGGNNQPLRQTSRLWRTITYRIDGIEG